MADRRTWSIRWGMLAIAIVLAILALELAAYFWGGITLTREIQGLGARHPVLILIFGLGLGLLIMHFFGRPRR